MYIRSKQYPKQTTRLTYSKQTTYFLQPEVDLTHTLSSSRFLRANHS